MAKIRNSFVANSSSSSFIIVTLGDKVIAEAGNTDLEYDACTSMDIDVLIQELQEAKAKGITQINFESGGGYDG